PHIEQERQVEIALRREPIEGRARTFRRSANRRIARIIGTRQRSHVAPVERRAERLVCGRVGGAERMHPLRNQLTTAIAVITRTIALRLERRILTTSEGRQ